MARRVGTWETRRTRLCAPLYTPDVHRAICALASHVSRNEATARLLARQLPSAAYEEQSIGELLDAALAILWHSQSVPRNAFAYELCQNARPGLHDVAQHMLRERDFAALSTLQHGATGTVEVVRCKLDKHLYVMKSILKGVARRESYRFSPVFESRLLAHEQASGYTPQLHAAFQGPGSVHIVMEYFPAGDLDSLLHAAAEAGPEYPGKSPSGGLLQEEWVLRYAADIVAAVGWLHGLQFVHRDVKPSNFLLHHTGRLKLCDFATCAPFATFGHERRVLAFYTQRPAGTCDYIAPDVLRCEEQRILAECPSPMTTASPSSASLTSAPPAPDACIPGAYGPEVDWWSVGVVLYEMVFGKLPFWAPQPADVYAKIAHHEQYLDLSPSVPCSTEMRALISSLLCAADRRLGRLGTEEVQRHPAFAQVPWHALDTYAVPFVPADTSKLTSGLLQSPGQTSPAMGDSVTMDTPPSFSQMYKGPLDLFPTFPDSFEMIQEPVHTPAAETHAASAEASPANSWPSSSAASTPATHTETGSGWFEIDTHFHGFSYVPRATAFASDEANEVPELLTVSPMERPLASTPMTKPGVRTPVSPQAWLASPEPQASLQRRAVQAALRMRNGPSELHTPFRKPANGPTAEPISPYPFPLASAPRHGTPLRALSPEAPTHTPARAGYDTMGSDSRHSGGSTFKRNLSERQAWTEMMDAVQRSARKLDASQTRPETSLRSLAEQEEEALPPLPPLPQLPAVPSRLGGMRYLSHSGVASPSTLENSPEKDLAPALRSATSCFDLRRRALPLETSFNANVPEERPMLRTRRSTRQLLLDAQVTSTPTRTARGSSLPSPSESLLDVETAPSPPRRRTLRGSASVRDFRDVMRQDQTLPTLDDASPPPAQQHRHFQRTDAPGLPSMDSHRTLSEYRRGLGRGPAPCAPEPANEDAFGRPTGLQQPALRSWERAARRMKSSLGLSSVYRQPSGDAAKENLLQRMTTEHRGIQRSVTHLEEELNKLKHRMDHVAL